MDIKTVPGGVLWGLLRGQMPPGITGKHVFHACPQASLENMFFMQIFPRQLFAPATKIPTLFLGLVLHSSIYNEEDHALLCQSV
jgi:hypothetical protein